LRLMGDNGTLASYFQAGGTNHTTTLYLEPGFLGAQPSFTLNDGLLTDNEVDLFGDDFGGGFILQNGGTPIVSNILNIACGAGPGASAIPATYQLNGGKLSAPFINLNGTPGDAQFFQSNGVAQFNQFHASASGPFSFFTMRMKLSDGT